MGVFVSKTGHCLHEILGRVQSGEWPVDVPFIASNHRDLEPVAAAYGMPFKHFPITPENRAAQEQAQIALIQEYKIDFSVLARYMIILGDHLSARSRNRSSTFITPFCPHLSAQNPITAPTNGASSLSARPRTM